jgi:hypothetical protein
MPAASKSAAQADVQPATKAQFVFFRFFINRLHKTELVSNEKCPCGPSSQSENEEL